MSTPPPKPWERRGPANITASGPTSAPKPWDHPPGTVVSSVDTTTNPSVSSMADAGISQPAARPWERPGGGPADTGLVGSSYSNNGNLNSYSGYNNGAGLLGNSNGYGYASGPSTYGSGMYGSGGTYGSGSMYGSGGMYGGSSMYGSGGTYGSSMYGSGGTYGSSMYGSGMYGRGGMYGGAGVGGAGYGGGMYGTQYGGMGGPYANAGGPPFGPNNPPPGPPSTWAAFLAAIGGVMNFFGRLSFLVDENAHAVHFFISALLQMLDRAGSLYAEIARFILRILLRRRVPKGGGGPHPPGKVIAGPEAAVGPRDAQALMPAPSPGAPPGPAIGCCTLGQCVGAQAMMTERATM